MHEIHKTKTKTEIKTIQMKKYQKIQKLKIYEKIQNFQMKNRILKRKVLQMAEEITKKRKKNYIEHYQNYLGLQVRK